MQINADTVLRRIIEGTPLGTGPDNVKGSVFVLASNVAAAAVEAAGYLNVAAGILRKGDTIIASLDNDGTVAGKTYIVTALTPNVVIAAAP